MRYVTLLVLVAASAGADSWKEARNLYLLGFRGRDAVWIRSDGKATRPDEKIRFVQGGVLSRDLSEWTFARGGDLFVCKADGTAEQRLLHGATQPSWSRTGKYVMCVVNGHICRIERATGKVDRFGAGAKPQLNSVGKLLAYLDGTDLVVLTVENRTRRVLAKNVTGFAWSMAAAEKIAWAGKDGIHLHDAINDKSRRVVAYRDLDVRFVNHRAHAFAWNYPDVAVAFRIRDVKTGAIDGPIHVVGLTGKPRTVAIPNGLSVADLRWTHASRWWKRIW
jgi:hypothetical protein